MADSPKFPSETQNIRMLVFILITCYSQLVFGTAKMYVPTTGKNDSKTLIWFLGPTLLCILTARKIYIHNICKWVMQH